MQVKDAFVLYLAVIQVKISQASKWKETCVAVIKTLQKFKRHGNFGTVHCMKSVRIRSYSGRY